MVCFESRWIRERRRDAFIIAAILHSGHQQNIKALRLYSSRTGRVCLLAIRRERSGRLQVRCICIQHFTAFGDDSQNVTELSKTLEWSRKRDGDRLYWSSAGNTCLCNIKASFSSLRHMKHSSWASLISFNLHESRCRSCADKQKQQSEAKTCFQKQKRLRYSVNLSRPLLFWRIWPDTRTHRSSIFFFVWRSQTCLRVSWSSCSRTACCFLFCLCRCQLTSWFNTSFHEWSRTGRWSWTSQS